MIVTGMSGTPQLFETQKSGKLQQWLHGKISNKINR
jgi:hypothetical protein